MPELPDLEVFSKNLQRKLKGKVVKTASAPAEGKLNVPAARFARALKDQTITEVRREGKELHIIFGKKHTLALHLMLNGRLILLNDHEAPRHTIVALYFKDGSGLALTDFRYMAKPTLDPEPSPAPDALSPEVNARFLEEQLATRRGNIKSWLLDQNAIRGIGNAYADEILWDARISPFSICKAIPSEKIKALARSLRKVLKHAIQHIRREHPDIISGEIRDFLAVHHTGNRESPTGAPVRVKTAGGRKTYYTDEQEEFGH